MGKFIISHTETGVRFSVVSAKGQTLAVSRDYANTDACKKGIAALIRDLPGAPLVPMGAGGVNPKCEMEETAQGFLYRVKSSNGKTLMVSEPMRSEKALRRALTMLRAGIENPELLYEGGTAGALPAKCKRVELARKTPEKGTASTAPRKESSAAPKKEEPLTAVPIKEEPLTAVPIKEESLTAVPIKEESLATAPIEEEISLSEPADEEELRPLELTLCPASADGAAAEILAIFSAKEGAWNRESGIFGKIRRAK